MKSYLNRSSFCENIKLKEKKIQEKQIVKTKEKLEQIIESHLLCIGVIHTQALAAIEESNKCDNDILFLLYVLIAFIKNIASSSSSISESIFTALLRYSADADGGGGGILIAEKS